MKTNTRTVLPLIETHGGAQATRVSNLAQLRRSVCSCLLWEKEAYESGELIADRIAKLIRVCKPDDVAALAIEAREEFNLRHVPLFIVRELARHPKLSDYPQLVSRTLARVIQRADEINEFLSIYWKNGKEPLSKQVKRGLSWAFHKFDEYKLGKYNADKDITLKDVMFLTHVKPLHSVIAWNGVKIAAATKYRGETFRHTTGDGQLLTKLADDKLETPDTWEVELSAGKDKKETFERLIREGKLGYLALIRNLRNMEQAKCDETLVKNAIIARKGGAERVLPFRFLAAAKAAPRFETALDEAMVANLAAGPKLTGKTIVIVDVSGSMNNPLSEESDMNRLLAACALAAILREVCEDPHIYATGGNDGTRIHKTEEVPARRGMALVDAISKMMYSLGGGGIFLTPVLRWLLNKEKTADRIIVITDEQDCSISAADKPTMAQPFGVHNYMLNVASAKNGIGYKPQWTHVDGFSEAVIRFIVENEREAPIQNLN